MPEPLLSPPSTEVLDLFAVPGPAQPLTGGQGGSWRAGDLVLSPGREAATQEWLSPVLARLAVRLDERAGRRPRDLRLAVPVPARNGAWVVDGWAASRFEPGTSPCRELPVLVAAGRLLHAELAVAVGARPDGLDRRTDRWAVAERVAFGEEPPPDGLDTEVRALLQEVRRREGHLGQDLGPGQLVHADLANNLLLDRAGAPVVIDPAPAWRPALWAEAVMVLDAVLWHDADRAELDRWSAGRHREAMLRAVTFRAASDRPCDVSAYRGVLRALSG